MSRRRKEEKNTKVNSKRWKKKVGCVIEERNLQQRRSGRTEKTWRKPRERRKKVARGVQGSKRFSPSGALNVKT